MRRDFDSLVCERGTLAGFSLLTAGHDASEGRRRSKLRWRPRLACLWLLLLWIVALPRGCRAEKKDVRLNLGPFYFNPSVVQYQGVYLATARTAYMKSIKKNWWWFNKAYLCKASDAGFTTAACDKFDPWKAHFVECRWKGTVDTHGIEDPKLFVWTGKGVYAIFGRKPAKQGKSAVCKGDIVFQQYLVQVLSAKGTKIQHPHPIALSTGKHAQEYYRNRTNVKEKNWMPLIYENDLYMVHSLQPHTVFKMGDNGKVEDEYITESQQIFSPFRGKQIHGGPPVVYINGTGTESRQSYYLGILHYFEWDSEEARHYHHFAYKIQPEPPFHVCAVSSEISLEYKESRRSLTTNDWKHQRIWKDTSYTAYVSGLFVDKNNKVYVSYGSSDIDSRMLTMDISELEALFLKTDICGPPQED